MSELIKINPCATLTEFCAGLEKNKEVHLDTQVEEQEFNEHNSEVRRTADRRKRLKTDRLPAADEWCSAKQLLMESIPNVLDAQFAGVIMNPGTRMVLRMCWRDKSTGHTTGTVRSGMDLLCMDDSAAIQITLWDEALASFQRQFEDMPSETSIIIELRTFKMSKIKKRWKTKILSPMQKIESVCPWGKQKGTVVKLIEWSSYYNGSPFLLRKKIQCGPHVPSSICITNFASCGTGLSPPWAGSFAGIVQKAWPIERDVRGTVDILDFYTH